MTDSNDISVDDLLAGLVADQLSGREPDLQALLDAHPDLADEIRARYRDLERLSVLWREGPVEMAPEGLVAGTIIGEYEIEREIGRGGMGVVYLARQKDLDRRVALKVIPPATLSAITRQRFLREARALASLSHPNIVPVFTAGEQAGSLFIAMEYVPGVSLSALIEAVRNRPSGMKATAAWTACLAADQPPAEQPVGDSADDMAKETVSLDVEYLRICLSVAGQIAGALTQAHAGGVIHRDVKPANIIIAPDGRARLLDFGLAAVHTEPHVTISGEFFGTPHYVSPEQAAGQSGLVGPASDQYSLGATLYECLTLRPPFDGDSISVVLSNVLSAEPRGARQVNPTLPKDIDTILAKTLSKRPQNRYDTAADFAEDLERFSSGRPILARRANWLQHLAKWARRRPAVAILLVLVIAMLLGGAAVWSWQEHQRQLVEQAADETEIQAKKDRTARIAQAETTGQLKYAAVMSDADRQWRTGKVAETKRLLLEAPPAWRNWEWDLLNWRCGAENQSWSRQGGSEKQSLPLRSSAMFLAWRPDGKALAVSSNVGHVQVWDPATGKVLRAFFPAPGYTGGVAWLAGGKQLAAACADGQVRLWDPASGKQLRTFSGAPPGTGKSGRVITELAVSADEHQLLTVGGDLNVKGWVRLHDLTTGRLVKSFAGHGSIIDAVAFTPDGKGFATVGRDGMVYLWDASQSTPIRSMRGHGSGFRFVYDVVFSPDGRTLATSGEGGLVQLWDSKAAKILRTFRSTGSDVRAVAFSPDGSLLAGVAVDGAATLWEVATGRRITVFRGDTPLMLSVGFSPDGKRLATSGADGAKIWDLRTRQEGVSFGRPGALPAFTSDGEKIAAVNRPGGGLGIYSKDGRPLVTNVKELGDRIAEVACHPIKPDLAASVNAKGRLDLWDLAKNRSVWTIKPPSDDKITRRGLAFSPDGRFLAVGKFRSWLSGRRQAAVVDLYDDASGKLLKSLTFPHCDTIVSVAFSPDGLYVAAASWYLHPPPPARQIPGGVALWRVSDGKYIRTLLGQDTGLYSFAFSPNSKQIALGNNNNVIRVLDVETAEVRSVMRGHQSRVVALAFSPDGRRIVSAGFDKVMLWDLFTAQSVMTLWNNEDGYNRQFHSVAFSPDGAAVVAGGVDRQMRIWSVPAGSSTGPR